jgi:mannose-6-phosphate isomerase
MKAPVLAEPGPPAAPTTPSADSPKPASRYVNPLHPAVVPVLPAVKNYPWGSPGARSAVAALYARSCGAAVDAAKPFAELWIGTHESTPCSILSPEAADVTLREFIQDQVIMVDPDKVAHYSSLHASGLPFLLKVLSVAKPLSIQAHPDLGLAAELHARAPDLYKDANHKPELAVAISPFEALCGFRTMSDIMSDIVRVPEFADAADRVVSDQFVQAVKTGAAKKTALRHLFASLMSRDAADIAAAVASLVERLGKMDEDDVTERDQLLLHLNSHFPRDVGCFAAYLLTHVHMEPGQSVFIDANEPHAYLSGDCVEIMATSDNVVRAGLTGKAKDVDTLVSMLTYGDEPIELSDGRVVDDYAVMYAPPVKEFMLVRYKLPVGVTYELQQTTAPTVIVVLSGEGFIQVRDEVERSDMMLPLATGSVFYLRAATTHTVTSRPSLGLSSRDAKSNDSNSLFFFRAGTNEAAIPSDSNCSVM